MAPTPLVAANFIVLENIIKVLGPAYSRLAPRTCRSFLPLIQILVLIGLVHLYVDAILFCSCVSYFCFYHVQVRCKLGMLTLSALPGRILSP
jgi:hypothetical protein